MNINIHRWYIFNGKLHYINGKPNAQDILDVCDWTCMERKRGVEI